MNRVGKSLFSSQATGGLELAIAAKLRGTPGWGHHGAPLDWGAPLVLGGLDHVADFVGYVAGYGADA
jgi:hypothetical protein